VDRRASATHESSCVSVSEPQEDSLHHR
jgi:hypothetical protein